MAQNEIHVNDIGTVFQVTIKDASAAVDVSGATAKTIRFEKPDGTTVTKTAAFVGTGTDGKIKYTTLAGDLDIRGKWMLQAFVEGVVGTVTGSWSSDIHAFEVHRNIEVAS